VYKYLIIGISGLLCLSVARAQYISEILEYTPAPGQHINTVPSGIPSAAGSLIGGVDGMLSLGSFGGYVVFRFEHAVHDLPDHPYGVDFTIFGNALTDWSEPAVVWVMPDENRNRLPDDTWYELAGSEQDSSGTIRHYEVTYTHPGDTADPDIPWIDNHQGSGLLHVNEIHTQPYYPMTDSFPQIDPKQYTLKGTLIRPAIDTSDPGFIKSYPKAWGYADNYPRGTAPWTLPDNPETPETENAGGDAFDIAWAIDSLGSPVHLDSIHFIKVQSATLATTSWLGELSTEIRGAAMVAPLQTGHATGPESRGTRIFPNPARDAIRIRGIGYASAFLYDPGGRLVYHNPALNEYTQVDLSGLPPGVYVLRIMEDGAVKTLKLIKP
jgi:hypothetical protein